MTEGIGPTGHMEGLISIRPEIAASHGDYLTPSFLLQRIEDRWKMPFFDPCPWPRPEWDGLKIAWPEAVFINPPYGKGVSEWFEKAIHELSNGKTEIAVFLLHARTDTKWFHEYVIGGAQELHFIRGRVKFEHPLTHKANSSPFPSIIAVFYSDSRNNNLKTSSWGKADE